MGEPVRQRHAFGQNNIVIGEIYAYNDPTKLLREIELNFDSTTQKMVAIYGYPWDMTWTQCKSLWGDKVTTTKNPDGSRFHTYKDRNLHVLVGKDERVVNLGSW